MQSARCPAEGMSSGGHTSRLPDGRVDAAGGTDHARGRLRRREPVETRDNKRRQSAPARTGITASPQPAKKKRRKPMCGLDQCGVKVGRQIACIPCGNVSHAGGVLCDAYHRPPKVSSRGSPDLTHLQHGVREEAEAFRDAHTTRADPWCGNVFEPCGACLCRKPGCFLSRFQKEKKLSTKMCEVCAKTAPNYWRQAAENFVTMQNFFTSTVGSQRAEKGMSMTRVKNSGPAALSATRVVWISAPKERCLQACPACIEHRKMNDGKPKTMRRVCLGKFLP